MIAHMKPRPSADQPGSLAQQLAAINVALYLGSRRNTSAAEQWADARRLVIPHARKQEATR